MLPSTDPTTIQPPQNILFGIPKKGRLNEKVCKLLEGAGLEYRRVRVVCWMMVGGRGSTYALAAT